MKDHDFDRGYLGTFNYDINRQIHETKRALDATYYDAKSDQRFPSLSERQRQIAQMRLATLERTKQYQATRAPVIQAEQAAKEAERLADNQARADHARAVRDRAKAIRFEREAQALANAGGFDPNSPGVSIRSNS